MRIKGRRKRWIDPRLGAAFDIEAAAVHQAERRNPIVMEDKGIVVSKDGDKT